MNPTMMAFESIGKAFEGEAEALGLKNDDDVVAMIKEIRRENEKLKEDPFFSEQNMARLSESIASLESGEAPIKKQRKN